MVVHHQQSKGYEFDFDNIKISNQENKQKINFGEDIKHRLNFN